MKTTLGTIVDVEAREAVLGSLLSASAPTRFALVKHVRVGGCLRSDTGRHRSSTDPPLKRSVPLSDRAPLNETAGIFLGLWHLLRSAGENFGAIPPTNTSSPCPRKAVPAAGSAASATVDRRTACTATASRMQTLRPRAPAVANCDIRPLRRPGRLTPGGILFLSFSPPRPPTLFFFPRESDKMGHVFLDIDIGDDVKHAAEVAGVAQGG